MIEATGLILTFKAANILLYLLLYQIKILKSINQHKHLTYLSKNACMYVSVGRVLLFPFFLKTFSQNKACTHIVHVAMFSQFMLLVRSLEVLIP